MGVKEFIEKHKRKDKVVLAEKITEQVEQTYQDVKENENQEIATETATKTAYELYEEWKSRIKPEERGEFVQRLATELVEKKGIPYEVAADFINKMIDDENVPNKYIIEPAKSLPSEDISSVVANENISLEHKEVLVDSMEDEQIRQKAEEKIKKEKEERRIKIEKENTKKKKEELKKLVKIYSECSAEKSEFELIKELKEFDNSKKYDTAEVEKIKQRIIAKKIAYNYSKFGITMLGKLTDYMPPTKMVNINMAEIVQKEYEKLIIRTKEPKAKTYDKEKLKEQIFEQEERKIYQDSEYNQENEIQRQLERAGAELRVLPLKDRKSEVESFRTRINDKKIRDIYRLIESSGMIEALGKVSPEEAKRFLAGSTQVIEKRIMNKEKKKYKVAEETPKIKGAEFKGEER